MDITSTAIKHQRNNVEYCKSNNSGSYSFFNLLTSDLLLDKVEELLPSHRERLFPPTETLSMFLSQALSQDRSCQNIVSRTAVQRLTEGLPRCSTYTGGYCRARERLPFDMVEGLAQYLGRELDRNIPEKWLWKNRKVRIVDGTTVTMPDTESNRESFPPHNERSPGLGFPICRVVGITSLETGALLDAGICSMSGKGASETALLRDMQDTLQEGDILLGDALFSSYFLIARMLEKGVDIVMEQLGSRKKTTDFRRGKKLGERDHLIILSKPRIKPNWMSNVEYEIAPESIEVRELLPKQQQRIPFPPQRRI